MIHLAGPLAIHDFSVPPSVQQDDLGEPMTVYPLVSGVHYTADAATFARCAEVLGPYAVQPSKPLQAVMAGDNPAAAPWVTGAPNPAWNTVPLRFPDQATADAAISTLSDPD